MSKSLCFVPEKYAPLSRFILSGGSEPIALPVTRAVADYLKCTMQNYCWPACGAVN